MADTALGIPRRDTRRLWVGMLTGPAAWAIQLVVNAEVEEFSCAPAVRNQGVIWGIGVETIILSVTVILSLATVAAGILSYTSWRKYVKMKDSSAGQVATWMSVVGMMASVLFLIIIVLGVAPPVVLSVCQTAP